MVTTDALRLQSGMDCLASLVALRPTWAGTSPSHMSRTLIDALVGALRLELVYIRLDHRDEDTPIQEARTSLEMSALSIDTALREHLGKDLTQWPRSASGRLGAQTLSIATVPLAFAGEIGALVAASDRPDFPTKGEALILDVSANQLLLALHEERRLKQPDPELDFQSIIDLMPIPVAVTTPGGEIEGMNQNALDYFGRTLEELKGYRSLEVIHPDDLPGIFAAQQAARKPGPAHAKDFYPFDIEYRARRFDGVYRWVHSRGYPLRDAHGRVVRAYSLFIDIDERKRAEEALSARERELRLIVDSIPGMVAVFSAAGELEAVNSQVLAYFGATLEELKDWAGGGFTHPEDGPRQLGAFTRSIASGEPFESEIRARRFDGVYRWVESRGYPLRDASGGVVRWYNLLIDIDERKRAEEALAARERDARLIVNTIPGMVSLFTPEGVLEDANEQAIEYIGQTIEDLRSFATNGACHAEDVPRVMAAFTRSLASGEPYEFEARVRRFDGVHRWCQGRGRAARDANGRIARWYALLIDIDDRKRAESALKRAYDSIADAQRLSRTGSFITDLLADDHTWSDEAYRIFEFELATKVTVQRIRDIVHPDDLRAFDSVIARGGDGKDVHFDFRIVTASRAVKHVRGLAHVIEKVAGRPMFVGALQDVTETRVAEQARDKARSELDHASRAMSLGVLTASIAHEVNQPLSGVITNASTCLRMLGADPPNLEGALETARRTIRDGHRASDIVTRLRTMFGKKDFAAEAVDLNEAAREVVALTLRELQRHGIGVRVLLDEELPNVIGDRVQLQQVLVNLLLNASDATRGVEDRPREIFVETARDAGAARLAVRDTGVGILPDSLSKLFDAFFTTKAEGMGIGLSVSRSIVERHGGRLWATNNDGPGATFAFSIPCATADGDTQGTTRATNAAANP
jgi:PAS domain S-box-containing protein